MTLGYDVGSGETTDAFESQSETLLPSDAILKVIYIVIGTIGLLGNAFVVIVICNFRAMLKRVPNLFIVNQSLIDGTASLILLLSFTINVDGKLSLF